MGTFTIKEVKDTGFTDPHGNHWLNAAFKEFGEPVSLVVKDPSKYQAGTSLNGEIKQVDKKSGNGTYNRFFRDKPQEFNSGFSPAPKREWKDNSEGQRKGNAEKIAADYVKSLCEANSVWIDDENDWAKEVLRFRNALITNDHGTEPEVIDGWKVNEEAKKLIDKDEDDNSKPLDVSDIPF